MEYIIIFSQKKQLVSQILKQIDRLTPETDIRTFCDPLDMLSFAAEKQPLSGAIIDMDSPACFSLKLIKIFHALRPSLPVIFVSKSGRYAVESFQYGAIDYLPLPFSSLRLKESMKKLHANNHTTRSGRVYITTFGSFEIFVGGVAIPWKNSKTKELLAFLVDSRGASVSSQAIKKALWGNAPEQKAASNYHTTLHNLRKKLESNGLSALLKGTRGSQQVNTDLFDCDLYEFEHYVEDGSESACRKAFALYKGRYLENNAYPWSHLTKLRIDIEFEQLCHNI